MSLLRKVTPRGLFWRSLLIMLVPLVLLQCVVAYIFYERHWDTVSRRLALGIAGDVVYVMRELQREDDPDERQWLLDAARHEMQIDITLEPGSTLPNDAPRLSSRILDRVLYASIAERLVYPFHIDTRRDDKKLSIRIQLRDGVMNVLTPQKRMDSSTTYIFVLWMVGTSLVVAALAVVFLRNQIRPIRRLVDAAEAFGKGRDVKDFKPSGAREIRQAASAFIQMRLRIRRHLDQRTEMLAGVSHDLRTPLTRIKLQLAMLDEVTRAATDVEGIGADIAEMEHMIDEYLAFARGQEGEMPVNVNLSALLAEVAEDAQDQGADVELTVPKSLNIPIRPNAMKRCLANLTENATHFGRHVRVSAKQTGNIVQVVVEDDGPGVPDDHKENVFKPFYRLDESRNPNTGGAGLGLAIARDVARGHGGDLRLQDSDMGGLRAILRLPV